MSTTRRRTAELLDALQPRDGAGRFVGWFLIVLIIANVLAIVLETVPEIGASHGRFFQAFEVFSVAVFTLEYLLRLWSCVDVSDPARPGHRQTRLRWALSPLGLIDLLAIAPFYLFLLLPEATAESLLMLRVFRGLRLMRVLKLSRYSPAMNVLLTVLRREARVLGVALFILAFMLVLSSWGIYFLEHAAQPEAFGSIPRAMWWAIVSLTTVGYGDVVPVTNGGKVFAGFVTLVGVGMVALPSAILVAGLTREMRRRSSAYHRAVELALADGEFTVHESTQLQVLREELGINADDALQTELRVRHATATLVRCPYCGHSLLPEEPENKDDT